MERCQVLSRPRVRSEKPRRIRRPPGRDPAANGKALLNSGRKSQIHYVPASGPTRLGRRRSHARPSQIHRVLEVALQGPGDWPHLSDCFSALRKRSREAASSPADRGLDVAAGGGCRRLSGHRSRSPPTHPRVTTASPMSAPATLPGSRSDHFPLLLCVLCKRPQERSGGVICGSRFVCRACFSRRNFTSVLARKA